MRLPVCRARALGLVCENNILVFGQCELQLIVEAFNRVCFIFE